MADRSFPVKFVWVIGGWASLSLGFIGIFLPLLPTTPFILLAAYCFSRGSAGLHHWLIHQPKFGPLIRDWEESGSISLPAKLAATVCMVVLFTLTLLVLNIETTFKGVLCFIGIMVLVFIWTRPHSCDKRALEPHPLLE